MSTGLEDSQLLFCGGRALRDWGEYFLVVGLANLENALAIFGVAHRCQDRGFFADDLGADYRCPAAAGTPGLNDVH
jgi:hypothetical protein